MSVNNFGSPLKGRTLPRTIGACHGRIDACRTHCYAGAGSANAATDKIFIFTVAPFLSPVLPLGWTKSRRPSSAIALKVRSWRLSTTASTASARRSPRLHHEPGQPRAVATIGAGGAYDNGKRRAIGADDAPDHRKPAAAPPVPTVKRLLPAGKSIIGIASMYDPGDPTDHDAGNEELASGERYDPDGWTAAIRTDLRKNSAASASAELPAGLCAGAERR